MRIKPPVKLCVLVALFSLLLVQCQSDPYLQVKQRYPTFQMLTDFTGYHGPRWSPDGTQFVFDNLANWIVISKSDGTQAQSIKDKAQIGQTPDWSPDGQRIVFASRRDGNLEIYVMNVDGSNVVQLTRMGFAAVPVWSPDGKRITFFHDTGKKEEAGIYLMDSDGANIAQLTHYPLVVDLAFEWSPDSTHIVFTAVDESPRGEGQPTLSSEDKNPRVYAIKADGSDLLLLEKDMSGAVFPMWSPDGKYVLFGHSSSPVGFFLVNADGLQLRPVLDGFYCLEPNWSRANNRLVCECMRGPQVSQLCTIDMKEALK